MTKKVKFCLFITSIIFSQVTLSKDAPWVGSDFQGYPCPSRPQNDGPYDYLSGSPLIVQKLKTVRSHHLTSNVLNHTSGQSNVNVSVDLDFALRVFPNHHVALLSLSRYKLKIDKNILKNRNIKLPAPIECYFQRAINFKKDDSATLSLYAYFLKKMGRTKESEKQYKKAMELTPKNAKIAYSYSLLLIELKKYKEAFEYAQKAYKYGKPPMTLKNKLLRLGAWK